MRRCAAAWSNISTRSDFIALPKDRTPRNNDGIVFFKEATAGRGALVRTVAMKPDRLLVVFVALYLVVIAILLIKDAPRPGTPEGQDALSPRLSRRRLLSKRRSRTPLPRSPLTLASPAQRQTVTRNCGRTTDLLRFFANRIQAGEDTQTVVADMRQQEKKIAAVCD
jgi:hypothetical protein